ncbi:MAG: hypothetical protein KTR31_03760 [Myxococcales bacterium]|nr:hypothetical protein [Myxococcales bacterium]
MRGLWMGVVLCVGGACVAEDGVEHADADALWRAATVVALQCPTGLTEVTYDGEDSEVITYTPDDFWLGTGSCRGYEDEPESVAAQERVDEAALEECEGDAVSFTCPEPCVGLSNPGTCVVTPAAPQVQENPPDANGVWSCVVTVSATAEATAAGACLKRDDPKQL